MFLSLGYPISYLPFKIGTTSLKISRDQCRNLSRSHYTAPSISFPSPRKSACNRCTVLHPDNSIRKLISFTSQRSTSSQDTWAHRSGLGDDVPLDESDERCSCSLWLGSVSFVISCLPSYSGSDVGMNIVSPERDQPTETLAPITYTSLQAYHLEQVHDLLARAFWAGIDGSSSLFFLIITN